MIILSSILSLLLFFQLPVQTPSRHSVPLLHLIPPTTNSTELQAVKGAVELALSSYLANCPGADELRPLTQRCLSTFGFQATLIESIESLIVLDEIELLQTALDSIGYSFCGRLSTVHRKELWERVVCDGIMLHGPFPSQPPSLEVVQARLFN
jgi:hypothetical protein